MAGFIIVLIFLLGMEKLEIGREQLRYAHLGAYPQGDHVGISSQYQRSAFFLPD